MKPFLGVAITLALPFSAWGMQDVYLYEGDANAVGDYGSGFDGQNTKVLMAGATKESYHYVYAANFAGVNFLGTFPSGHAWALWILAVAPAYAGKNIHVNATVGGTDLPTYLPPPFFGNTYWNLPLQYATIYPQNDRPNKSYGTVVLSGQAYVRLAAEAVISVDQNGATLIKTLLSGGAAGLVEVASSTVEGSKIESQFLDYGWNQDVTIGYLHASSSQAKGSMQGMFGSLPGFGGSPFASRLYLLLDDKIYSSPTLIVDDFTKPYALPVNKSTP